MANRSTAAVAAKLAHSRYRASFVRLFGTGIVDDPQQLVDEAMFAIGRFEIEDPSFHPFTSKYDAWLQGQARLTPAETRGQAQGVAAAAEHDGVGHAEAHHRQLARQHGAGQAQQLAQRAARISAAAHRRVSSRRHRRSSSSFSPGRCPVHRTWPRTGHGR